MAANTQTLSTVGAEGRADVATYARHPHHRTGQMRTWATVNGKHMFLVNKTSVANASARGGAYKDAYKATTRGLVVIEDTRTQAVEGMVRLLRSRGFTV